MYIVDKANHAIAVIENKMIIQLETGISLGVVLGNCVYNRNGKWVGKLFDNFFRNRKGFITGKVVDDFIKRSNHQFENTADKAWKIISLTGNQPCEWVLALDEWDEHDFLYFLKEEKVMAV